MNRGLSKINARMIQHFMWRHSDLGRLAGIAMPIKSSGRRARILEERLLS